MIPIDIVIHHVLPWLWAKEAYTGIVQAMPELETWIETKCTHIQPHGPYKTEDCGPVPVNSRDLNMIVAYLRIYNPDIAYFMHSTVMPAHLLLTDEPIVIQAVFVEGSLSAFSVTSAVSMVQYRPSFPRPCHRRCVDVSDHVFYIHGIPHGNRGRLPTISA